MPNVFTCGVVNCSVKFKTGAEHIQHLVALHGYTCNNAVPSAPAPEDGPSCPSVIFQDPRQDHDIYISYCPDNCQGGSAFSSLYHDPTRIAAVLSKTFKPWFASVCLGPKPTGDFYEDRALSLQKVKVFVAMITPEYSQSDQCIMEYQFALLSLKKPVLPVIIKPGKIGDTIDAYIKQDGRVPFLMESPLSSDKEFNERMGYLISAIKNMISAVDTTRETQRLNHLSLQDRDRDQSGNNPPSYEDALSMEQARVDQDISERVPQVEDHVIAHWENHSYFMATIIRFIKQDMTFEIRWDDQDESGRFPSVTMVALDKVPLSCEVTVGSRVFFPQGSYAGQAGVRTGGERYHEGIVSRIEQCSGGRVRCYGHHLKGGSDGKWVTYQGYSFEFRCFHDDLRVAPNIFNVIHAYSDM